MRFPPIASLLSLAGCALLGGCAGEKKTSLWPWNSRAQEQQRLNAATAPTPRTREDEILKPDETKEFNPSAANFGGRSFATKSANSNAFQFVDRTRTKGFTTRDFETEEARGMKDYATKDAPTKESWFSKLSARTKTYETKESRDAGKTSETRTLLGSDRTFEARGRRQAALDKDGAAGQPIGGDREGGQSWSGDLKPLTIQDVRALLNKN